MPHVRRNAGALLLLTCALVAPGPIRAQDEPEPDRGWLSAGAGAGRIDVATSTRSAFVLDLAGGSWLTDHLGLGVHLGGWTIEGFDLWDPEEGESVSELFLQLRFRPSATSPLSATVESGWASYTVNDPDRVSAEGDALGWRLGIGWDLAEIAGLTFAPSVVGSWGRASPSMVKGESFDYRAAGVLIGVLWSW